MHVWYLSIEYSSCFMMDSPSSPPKDESFDPGSSVSTNMMEEYEDLLRYAVITPNLNPASSGPKATLSLANGTIPHPPIANTVTTTPGMYFNGAWLNMYVHTYIQVLN